MSHLGCVFHFLIFYFQQGGRGGAGSPGRNGETGQRVG